MLWKRLVNSSAPGEHNERAYCGMDSPLTSREVPTQRAGSIVLAGGQALVRAARRSVLSRAGFDVAADVVDVSRRAKAAGSSAAAPVSAAPQSSGAAVLPSPASPEPSPRPAGLA